MIEESSKNGVKLIFFIAPRNITGNLLNLYYTIPEKNRIDIANPYKYKEFYIFKNSFDSGHLNNNGAKLLTTGLANEFINLVEDL